MKDLFRKKDGAVEHLGHIGLEDIDVPLNEAASIDDRIVSQPEPDEDVHEPRKKKGIVSVNGEDVDEIGSDNEKAA